MKLKCEVCNTDVGFWESVKMSMEDAISRKSLKGYYKVRCINCRLKG